MHQNLKIEEKQTLRSKIYELRGNLGQAFLERESRKVIHRVIAHPQYREAQDVLVYAGCKGEVLTDELISCAAAQGKRVAAPRVCGHEMIFHYIEGTDQLAAGYYGIPEPDAAAPHYEWKAGRKKLLIVPGVAFDLRGYRVGYGQGFYDRYLNNCSGVLKMALAFDFQIFDRVPREAHDQRMDCLLTERDCIWIES